MYRIFPAHYTCSVSFGMGASDVSDSSYILGSLYIAGTTVLTFTLPLFVALTIAGIAGSLATGGMILSMKAARPKLERVSPVAGIKRLLSLNTLVELIKAILKTCVFSIILYFLLTMEFPLILSTGQQDIEPAIATLQVILSRAFLAFSIGFLVIGLLDTPWQIYRLKRQLMMTRQEAKEGLKEEEGSPDTKDRIRRVRKELLNRRMLQDVPKADVVITNPEHFAVALRYDYESRQKHNVPIVIARGADLLAEKIIEIARKSGRPVVCQPPLARAVYYHVDIDQPIPAGLYTAVARVMAYIYLLNRYRAGRQAEPPEIQDIPVPGQYQR